MTDLPDHLRAYRTARDLTQAQAAARLGVKLDTLQNWEAGRNRPRGLALTFLLEKITAAAPAAAHSKTSPVQKSAARPARERVTKPTTGTRAATRGGRTKSNHETKP